MIVRDGKRFNCCESALIMIDEGRPLPDFESSIMKAASSLGGGVGGWGSACGAATGATIALGLAYGTDGEETLEEYSEKRGHLRDMSQVLLREFENEFGSVNCMDLLGVDRRTEEGKARYAEIKAQGLVKCDEYVAWCAKRTLEVLGES
jgi:C_GCAxxG_C_C family probable redox protein